MKSWKKPLAALTIGLALALSGCAPSANEEPAPATSEEGGTATDGTAGGVDTAATITVAYSEGGSTLNPYEASDVTSDTFVVAAYDQLVTYGRAEVDGKWVSQTDELVPMLAEEWEVSEDSTVYTFHLRDDVTFHNGSVLNADDVVGSFDLIANSSSASFLYNLAGIDSVTKIDDSTVEIALTAPNHLFLQILPQYNFSIVDVEEVNENGGTDWLTTNTSGTGPYTVEKWDPSTEAILERNDDYWGEAAAIKTVTMRFIAEASSRVQLISNNDVNMALELPAKDIVGLEGRDDIVVDSRASNKILFFAMNNSVAPFDNPLVRQAIVHAIPYDKLINDVMLGQASPMTSAIPSSMPGFDDSSYDVSYDLEKAQALLDEAGMGDGFEFNFVLGSGFNDWNDDAVLIQAELAKIGVTMNIENMARPQFLEAIATGEVQSYISRWTSFTNDPQYHFGLLFTEEGTSNYMNFRDAEFNELWQEAATEPDQSVRNVAYSRMQEIVNEAAPWGYLYEYNIVVVHSSGIEGYTSYPDGIIRYAQMSVVGE